MSARKRTESPAVRATPVAKANSEPAANGATSAPWLTVLSKEGLKHIAEHKYVAGKYTPLDMVLNPWWLALTDLFPKWVAPNVITFTGTSALMCTYALAWWVSPDFSETYPRWLAFLSAFAIFVYQTLDACDGKQARRIGLQTPMGQLFDHGCDILCCLSHHSMAAMILAPGPSAGSFFGLVSLQSGLFMAQWQEYYTGVLKTAMGAWGVTELQYSLVLANLAAGIAGPEATKAAMHKVVSLPWDQGQVSVSTIAIFGWGINCWVLAAISFVQVMQFIQKGPKEGRGRLLWSALRDLTPVVALNVIVLMWSPGVKWVAVRRITQLTALLFVFYSWQVVLFSMAKMPNAWLHPTLLAYAALVALSHSGLVATSTLILATDLFTIGIAGYMMVWLYSVTCQLTTKLNIKVFTVSRALWDKKA